MTNGTLRIAIGLPCLLLTLATACGDDGSGGLDFDLDLGGFDGGNDTGPVAMCGDGALNGTEVCDGSATPDGCTGDQVCNDFCTQCEPGAQPICGDGEVNGVEICDGSASPNGCAGGQDCNVGCTACQLPDNDVCGDAAVTGTEVCDESAADNGCIGEQVCNVGCTACTDPGGDVCGDGEVTGDEVCDASDLEDDGCELPAVCNETCTECGNAAPGCGDGAVAGDEVCDASSLLDTGCELPNRCNSACTACDPPPADCGDGELNGDETCDASAGAANSGCGDEQFCMDDCSACVDVFETCGDGDVNGDELCDASDLEDDGCDGDEVCGPECLTCQPVGCGDGELDEAEVCDQSAEDNGCDEGLVCLECRECTACGNNVLEGEEECDNDGVFGDLGVCDIEADYCNTSCECEPLLIEVVEAQGTGSGIPGALGFNLLIHEEGSPDERVFTRFYLYFLDADGFFTGFFRPGIDFLVDSRFTPLDDAEGNSDYEWNMQVHLLFGVPEGSVAAGLTLLTDELVPSNPVVVPFTEFFVGVEDDDCDSESFISWCDTGLACEADVCTVAPAFSLDSFTVTEGATEGSLRFELTVTDDGDVLPYWVVGVFDLTGEFVGAAYRGFDPVDEDAFFVDNGDGTLTMSREIPDAATDLGVVLEEVGSFSGAAFDTNNFGIIVDVGLSD